MTKRSVAEPTVEAPASASPALPRTILLISLVMALVTIAVYAPGWKNGFINFDDPDYVTANPRVQAGLTAESIHWAFTSYHSSNWHPVTWISHMLDWQLFGNKPSGHHLVSILLHALNSVLLFFVVQRLTSHLWRSAFVAALFALHPLHVESVAWISERKDLLSGLFFLLTLWAYAVYAQGSPSRRKWPYVAALAFFTLGLMSKPMLVTLPFVLLLLDFWPLQRLRLPGLPAGSQAVPIRPVLVEKAPFFFLAIASSAVTFIVQRSSGATVSLAQVPFELRLGNALLSYVRYLAKTFWPADLSVFYPFTPVTGLAVAGAVLLWVIVSAGALVWLRQKPYLAVGWFWFLGMLVPVIGLVQVGKQAFADRYTYLPHIGLFIALTWVVAEAFHRLKWPRLVTSIAVSGVLLGCALLTARQVPFWHDSKTLFTQAAAVTSGNYVAHAVIATALVDEGKLEEAIGHCKTALQFSPGYSEAHNTLGGIYLRQGKHDEALRNFKEALKVDPLYAEAHNGIGDVLNRQKQYVEAEPYLREALRLAPASRPATFNLAVALHNQGKLDEAAQLYQELLRADPSLFTPRRYLGNVLVALGKPDEAIAQFEHALKLKPSDSETRTVLGMVLLQQGRVDQAAAQITESIRLAPTNAVAHYQLALIQQGTGHSRDAMTSYSNAIALQPDWPEALNNLAWIKAANSDATVRNGTEAIRLAERACTLTENKAAVFLGTLAAAYAEAGQFPDAIATAEKARDLASAAGQEEIAKRNQQLLELYRAGKPFHE